MHAFTFNSLFAIGEGVFGNALEIGGVVLAEEEARDEIGITFGEGV